MLLVNDILHIKSDSGYKDVRILWISSNYETCFTIDLNISKIIIVERKINEIEDLIKDDVAELYNDSKQYTLDEYLSDSAKIRAEKAFEVVTYIFEQQSEPYLFDSHIRRKVILDAKQKFKVGQTVIYKYLRLFWQGGKLKNSLIPNFSNCGGLGEEKNYNKKTGRVSFEEMISGKRSGVIVDKDMKVIFQKVIDRYFNKTKERTLTKAYDLMIKDFFTYIDNGKKMVYDKSKIPTFRQFEYWYYKNRDLEEEIKSRKGNKKFSLNYRALTSNSTFEAFGPGHRYQLDATVADVYLVSRIDRTSIIGRPIVYLVVDVFSRLITGIYVGLEGPSWNGAASAIYNCCENKVEFCKKYGIDITNDQWPSEGLPQIILGDRGEMVGPIGEKIVEELNITLENTPSYRGDAKGIVEQKFSAINYNIKHWTPGAIKNEYRERGERDYRLDAVLDIDDFTKIILYAVLEKNNNPIKNYPLFKELIEDKVNPIPTEIWNWGIKNRTGMLKRVSNDLLRMSLMRKGRASVTKYGIIFKKVIYNTNLPEENSWYMKSRVLGQERIEIVYDNRDMSTIFIVDGKNLIPCSVKEENQFYANKTIEEIEDCHFNNDVNYEKLTNYKNQNILNMNCNVEGVINEAIKKGNGEKKNVKDIKDNRKNENYVIRKEQSLTNLGSKDNKNKKSNNLQKSTLYEDDLYDSNAKNINFIRNRKKRAN